MKTSRLYLTTLLPMLLASLACNLPGFTSSEAEPAVTIIVPTETPASAVEAPLPNDADVPAEPTLVSTEIAVEVPADWTEFQSDALSLTLAIPPGWEAQPVNTQKLDVRQQGTDAWLEINELDAENADEWSLTFDPAATSAGVLEQLVEAAQQDGSFNELQVNGDMVTAEGYNDLFQAELLIAAYALEDRWLLVLGHGTTNPDDWSNLLETYTQMIASVDVE